MVLEKIVSTAHTCDLQSLDWHAEALVGEALLAHAYCHACEREWSALIENDDFKALFFIDESGWYRCSCGATPALSYTPPFDGNLDDYDITCPKCHKTLPILEK